MSVDAGPRGASEPILRLRGIQKSFGPVHVLKGVDFEARSGEVTALVGDNGAGKSTLVKCIGGTYTIDDGEYLFDGKPVSVHSPRDASALGIEIVYQDLALCDNLDIVQNMFLGREEISGDRAPSTRAKMELLAGQTLASLSVRTVKSVRQKVSSLSGGQRQTVAIAKSVLWNSKLVILDEPTAALGVAQTAQVLDLVRRLADQGLAVVLISHNMNDVLAGRGQRRGALPRTDGGAGAPVRVTHTQIVELITAGRSGDIGLTDGRRGSRGERSRRMSTIGNDSRPAARARASGGPGPERDPSTVEYVRDYVQRLRGGEMGAIPGLLGLVVLVILFSFLQSGFLSAYNVENMVIDGAPTIIMAMGLVFVLLLGEIDLSAGTASGACAVLAAVLLVRHNVNWIVAALAAGALGAIIGVFIGWLRAKVGIPSFVITLAAFLSFQGVIVIMVGGSGSILVADHTLVAIESASISDYMPIWAGWVLLAVVVLGFAAVKFRTLSNRRKSGLPTEPNQIALIKVAALARAARCSCTTWASTASSRTLSSRRTRSPRACRGSCRCC